MIPLGDLGEFLLKHGSAELRELARSTGITATVVEELVRSLRGVTIISGEVRIVNRLELVLSLIEKGVDASRISRYLTWREFEEHASKALKEAGFNVVSDLRLASPYRMQVDVLGFRHPLALVVDCKHWAPRTSSPSRLRIAAENHRERTRRLVSTSKFWTIVAGGLERQTTSTEWLVYPILVTLRNSLRGPLAGSTIVPISMLPGFLAEIDYYRFDLPHIKATPPKP